MEELAYKDYLTGVYNYRYFHKKLEEELKKTDSCGKPMSIIMIGFHDFKKYTDKYGIDVGDKLLKDLSSEMNSIINKDKHILCRFSENIFSIILSETDEAEALKQAEIFRNKIDKYLHETDEHGIKFLNFSLGISVYPCLADSKEELVKSAVEAMQNSKHSPTGVKMYFSVFSDLKDKLVQTERELLGSLQTLLSIIDVRDHYTYG
ncbi:MAG TPA: GGDEF domain-containing protein, partial [Thermoanaerobacterales bacterium]|nr:GGDEF domain-containing protein [Thermoanaerobacterales bacterium]